MTEKELFGDVSKNDILDQLNKLILEIMNERGYTLPIMIGDVPCDPNSMSVFANDNLIGIRFNAIPEVRHININCVVDCRT